MGTSNRSRARSFAKNRTPDGDPCLLPQIAIYCKQLMNPLPLFSYNIHKDTSIVATLRLRGGSFRQTSSTPSFSYKDAVCKDTAQPQPSAKAAQPSGAPKPFLVDKLEEIPSIDLSHPGIDDCYQLFVESALICRFNGLWPRTSNLYQWIHTNWTKKARSTYVQKDSSLWLLT